MGKFIEIEVDSENQFKPILRLLKEKFPERYTDDRDGWITFCSDLMGLTTEIRIILKKEFGVEFEKRSVKT